MNGGPRRRLRITQARAPHRNWRPRPAPSNAPAARPRPPRRRHDPGQRRRGARPPEAT